MCESDTTSVTVTLFRTCIPAALHNCSSLTLAAVTLHVWQWHYMCDNQTTWMTVTLQAWQWHYICDSDTASVTVTLYMWQWHYIFDSDTTNAASDGGGENCKHVWQWHSLRDCVTVTLYPISAMVTYVLTEALLPVDAVTSCVSVSALCVTMLLSVWYRFSPVYSVTSAPTRTVEDIYPQGDHFSTVMLHTFRLACLWSSSYSH